MFALALGAGAGQSGSMSGRVAGLMALALLALLFAVATLTERGSLRWRYRPRLRHGAYTLALGV